MDGLLGRDAQGSRYPGILDHRDDGKSDQAGSQSHAVRCEQHVLGRQQGVLPRRGRLRPRSDDNGGRRPVEQTVLSAALPFIEGLAYGLTVLPVILVKFGPAGQSQKGPDPAIFSQFVDAPEKLRDLIPEEENRFPGGQGGERPSLAVGSRRGGAPIRTRSSSRARSTGASLKFLQDLREAIKRTSCAVSDFPGGSQRLSAANVANAETSGSAARTSTASAGQTAAQWPQPSERSPLTTALPSFMDSVCDGHTRTQRPHPMHRSAWITVVTVRSIIHHTHTLRIG